jgi:TPP-dependent pyruvate/acetoin dehydrogenase alpha subunit
MSLNKEQMRLLFRNLVRADHFDKMMMSRIMQGKLIGFYHPGDGAMAAGVGAATFLGKEDVLYPHHRAHGLAYMAGRGVDVGRYLAEHTGKTTGCCKGRSSFHFCFPEHKMYGASGFIGWSFSPAVGWGWASKRKGNGQIVLNCTGDGSYGEGRAHESMLMAANWKLPIIYFCENNGMAIHAKIADMHPLPDVSSLAQGYGMPAVVVDGQDVFAVAEVVMAAMEHARSGKGPIFVEAKTLRLREHDVGTPDLADHTLRDPTYLAEIKKREPLVMATQRVLAEKICTQAQIDEIYADAKAEVVRVEKFADDSPVAAPSIEELQAAVFAA